MKIGFLMLVVSTWAMGNTGETLVTPELICETQIGGRFVSVTIDRQNGLAVYESETTKPVTVAMTNTYDEVQYFEGKTKDFGNVVIEFNPHAYQAAVTLYAGENEFDRYKDDAFRMSGLECRSVPLAKDRTTRIDGEAAQEIAELLVKSGAVRLGHDFSTVSVMNVRLNYMQQGFNQAQFDAFDAETGYDVRLDFGNAERLFTLLHNAGAYAVESNANHNFTANIAADSLDCASRLEPQGVVWSCDLRQVRGN